MDISGILQIINEGESQTVEFKSSFNKAVIESIVAFANTKGGVIFIGVSNSGKITGISLSKESIQEWTNQIKQNTIPSVIPDIEIFEIEKKFIACITINEFPVKPISFKGRYYRRLHNSNQQMQLSEILNAHIHSLQLSWDAYECPDENIDSLDISQIDKFIINVNNTGRFYLDESPLFTLEKLKFIKNSNLLMQQCCYLLKLL